MSTLRLHEGISSRFLGNTRSLVVYLPPFYTPKKRYPVLYMHDGQNLFDPKTGFAGQCWEMGATADRLIRTKAVLPLIIVGIYNTGMERVNEYTSTPDATIARGIGGKAALYGKFLIEEVMPFIGKNYPVLHTPQQTGVGGSSLGGLISLWLGLNHPQVFGKLAVFSPSVWWDNRQVIKEVQQIPENHRPQSKIWLDMGTNEGNNPRLTLAEARLLKETLIGHGWEEGKILRYYEASGGMHNEKAWAARVAPMLSFLYADLSVVSTSPPI
jgi:predicted alpha/beta superfamily hydrolase